MNLQEEDRRWNTFLCLLDHKNNVFWLHVPSDRTSFSLSDTPWTECLSHCPYQRFCLSLQLSSGKICAFCSESTARGSVLWQLHIQHEPYGKKVKNQGRSDIQWVHTARLCPYPILVSSDWSVQHPWDYKAWGGKRNQWQQKWSHSPSCHC